MADQLTKWHISIACWLTKATNTLSDYAVIIAFPLQQWIPERSSVIVIRALRVLFNLFPAISTKTYYNTNFSHFTSYEFLCTLKHFISFQRMLHLHHRVFTSHKRKLKYYFSYHFYHFSPYGVTA